MDTIISHPQLSHRESYPSIDREKLQDNFAYEVATKNKKGLSRKILNRVKTTLLASTLVVSATMFFTQI